MKQLVFAIIFFAALGGIIVLVNRGNQNKPTMDNQAPVQKNESSGLTITSQAFSNNGFMPKEYTCDGDNVNPPLEIKGVPPEARSLLLIVDDPDAPGGVWTHWVVFNIDPSVTSISKHSVPQGGEQGVTNFGDKGYGGPCPPSGTHHYRFTIYALDTKLAPSDFDRRSIEQSMASHIISQSQLIGLYSR